MGMRFVFFLVNACASLNSECSAKGRSCREAKHFPLTHLSEHGLLDQTSVSSSAVLKELEGTEVSSATTNLLQNSLQSRRAAAKQPHDDGSENRTELVFIHIPKNAGSTIEATAKAYGFDWGLWMFANPLKVQLMPDGNRCSLKHVPPSLLADPNPYKDAEVFCVSRDPITRAVSEYLWVRTEKWKFGCPPEDPNLLVAEVPGCATLPACSAEGLNYFLQEIMSTVLHGQPFVNDCHMLPQAQYMWGHDSATEWCQHILRMEELDDDFSDLMRVNGLDAQLITAHNTAAKNCPNLTTEALSENTRLLINRLYRDDFVRLNYSFA